MPQLDGGAFLAAARGDCQYSIGSSCDLSRCTAYPATKSVRTTSGGSLPHFISIGTLFGGRKRVARLMRVQGLRARTPRRFRTTTDSRHTLPIAPNVLARRFTAPAPNTVWVMDITYLWTLEGWLYLVVILDLFSRRVVGWAMSERMTRQLTLDALTMALTHRRPARGVSARLS